MSAIAHRIATEYFRSRPIVTGLLKQCPGCGRTGEVFGVEGHEGFFVVWEGKARSGRTEDADVDTNVRPDQLLDPVFGCGYDDEVDYRDG